MATSFKLRGMKKFMRNFNDEVRKIRGRTHRGLIEAAIVLQRAAEPGTPIDTGNLRASWFIVSYKSGPEVSVPKFTGEDAGKLANNHTRVLSAAFSLAQGMGSFANPVVVFGYSANYAVFVHEAVDATFQRPTAHARWLYAAMQVSQDKMLDKIHQHARL